MPEPQSDRAPTEGDAERLRRENEQLRADLRRSEAERQRLRREIDKLKEELDAARRAASRQAAPFSRGTTVAQPRVPGRKPVRGMARRATGASPCTSTRPTTPRCRRSAPGAPGRSVLVRDGWQSYRQFHAALHQTCLAHLLRTCRRLLLEYPAQPFVVGVKALLQAALALRARHVAGTVSAHGLAVARGHLIARLGTLLARTPSRRLTVRRFQGHLITEFDAIFSFLFDPTLDATNWRAEQALRPAVVTRKMSGGGNRTARGADTQQVLASVLRTAAQRGLDRTALIVELLQARTPSVPESLRTPPAVH